MSDLPERLVARIDENMLQSAVAERSTEETEPSLNDQLRDVAVELYDKVVGDYIKRQSAGVIGRQLLNIRGISNPNHEITEQRRPNGRIETAALVRTPLLSTGPPTLEAGHIIDTGIRGTFEIEDRVYRRRHMLGDRFNKHLLLRVEQVAQDRETEECVGEDIARVDFNIPTAVPPDLYSGPGEWAPREPYIHISGLHFNDILHSYNALVEKSSGKSLSLMLDAAARSFAIAHNQGISHEEARKISGEKERTEHVELREKWCVERAKALDATLGDDMPLEQKERTIKESAEVIKQRAEEEKHTLLHTLMQLNQLAHS